MIHNSKEMQEFYTNQKVSNLVADQAAFNINTRDPFVDYRYAHSIIKEEIEELQEVVNSLKANEMEIWELIKRDAPEREIMMEFSKAKLNGEFAIREGCDVAASALKAIKQLGGNKNETISKSIKSQ